MKKMLLALLAPASSLLVSFASANPGTVPGETVQLGHPVIRALVLPVREGTTVEPVSGTVYITRHGREAIDLKAKETLQHDDLLHLQADSSARMRSPSGTELVLTAQHGEWFRFVIEDKSPLF